MFVLCIYIYIYCIVKRHRALCDYGCYIISNFIIITLWWFETKHEGSTTSGYELPMKILFKAHILIFKYEIIQFIHIDIWLEKQFQK